MKRILSMLLVGTMVFSALVGCGKKADTTKAPDAAKDTTPDYMNATGYPIVKQPITIKVMGQKSATQGEWKDMKLFTNMEKLTGIHMEFDTPIASAYLEKKNLALASGDVPDAFMYGNVKIEDEETYGPQGTFLALEGYISKYAPTLKATLEKYPEAKKMSTATDGHMYSLPYIANTKTRASDIMYFNMDWLTNVGMKKPTNVDEFYNVLKAFKEKDPNKNGKQDEIPFSYWKQTLPTSNLLYNTLIGAFTGQAGGLGFDVKDNKVVYNPLDPNFKDFIVYMNKLWTEGLLDKEMYTQTLQQMTAKYKSGIMGISTTSLSNVVTPGAKVNYEITAPLTSSKNSKQVAKMINFTSTGSFVLTNKCKYPEAMMRWIDVMFLDVDHAVNGLSGMMNFLGEYGVDWKYGDDKKTTYSRMSKVEGMNPTEYQQKFVAPQGFGNVSTDAVPDNDPLLLIKAVESDKNYHPYMKEAFPYGIRYKQADQEKLTLLENDLNTYVEQMVAKLITGDEPMSKYDEFQNKIKKDLKIDDILKIRQAAYDTYKSAK